ncbi:uncharacterized protein LOC121610585 isoform X2 [Chelmon rostratus]|uniref:uncharacterized protein LOC121610585 isoform X2 n=1 Tax=Chelmon rostratus TaxID=109905 RepID=UPI001BECE5BF|nr:uncharacterized protein LOC121610585 isoform X2 [Chelmon rostratus]
MFIRAETCFPAGLIKTCVDPSIQPSGEMSITVVKNKGVTVVTVASDSESTLPPLCQILKSLCYSPACCSVYEGLTQTNVVSALGTVLIMVGLFNIGLGPGRISHHPDDFAHLGVAYWLGGVYIAAGLVSVLAGRFPSLCSVGFAVFMNIIGAIMSIFGIVMYAIDIGDGEWITRMCDDRRTYEEHCIYMAYYYQRMVLDMDITMIVLAALQLCVCVSLSVLGIKAVLGRKKVEGDRDVEIYQPLLTEDLLTSPGA